MFVGMKIFRLFDLLFVTLSIAISGLSLLHGFWKSDTHRRKKHSALSG